MSRNTSAYCVTIEISTLLSVCKWCARLGYHGFSNILVIRKTQRVPLSIPIPPIYLADFFREFLQASSLALLFLYDVSLNGRAAHEKEIPTAAHLRYEVCQSLVFERQTFFVTCICHRLSLNVLQSIPEVL